MLFESIEKIKSLPAQIQVEKEEAYKFFKPVADNLSIPIKLMKELKEFPMAKITMSEFIKKAVNSFPLS